MTESRKRRRRGPPARAWLDTANRKSDEMPAGGVPPEGRGLFVGVGIFLALFFLVFGIASAWMVASPVYPTFSSRDETP